MHLQILKGDSGYWYVALVGGNGEPMMHSEIYDGENSFDHASRAATHIAEVTGLEIIAVGEDAGDEIA